MDLAAWGLRQFGDEFDLARVGVRREPFLDVLGKLFGEFVAALVGRRQHDEGLDDLGALRIGHADHGRLVDGRMLDQRAFDVERADAVAGRGDDVVGAADEGHRTVRLVLHRVAGSVVAADIAGVCSW